MGAVIRLLFRDRDMLGFYATFLLLFFISLAWQQVLGSGWGLKTWEDKCAFWIKLAVVLCFQRAVFKLLSSQFKSATRRGSQELRESCAICGAAFFVAYSVLAIASATEETRYQAAAGMVAWALFFHKIGYVVPVVVWKFRHNGLANSKIRHTVTPPPDTTNASNGGGDGGRRSSGKGVINRCPNGYEIPRF